MKLHADLTERVVINTNDMDWSPSPAKGVYRKMLDRDGAESGRATTIVKFDAGCKFPEHVHTGGEEFYVLDGEFEDEHSVYPKGCYVRHPIDTRHEPGTRKGCVLFVKLCQFIADDKKDFVVDTNNGVWEISEIEGVELMPLHSYDDEVVVLERWAAGAVGVNHLHPKGEEVLVLAGEFSDEFGTYCKGDWVRQPAGSSHIVSSEKGCLLWVKRGHLG